MNLKNKRVLIIVDQTIQLALVALCLVMSDFFYYHKSLNMFYVDFSVYVISPAILGVKLGAMWRIYMYAKMNVVDFWKRYVSFRNLISFWILGALIMLNGAFGFSFFKNINCILIMFSTGIGFNIYSSILVPAINVYQLKRLCRVYYCMSQNNKKFVYQNFDIVAKKISLNIADADKDFLIKNELYILKSLLSNNNLLVDIRKYYYLPESMVIHMGFMLINQLLYEHQLIVDEDREIYAPDANPSSMPELYKRRQNLVQKIKEFKIRWDGIEPQITPP